MNSYLSRLNPVERRFVVAVALVVFILINLIWVRPHFSDWGNCQNRLNGARLKQENYAATVAKAERLKVELDKLESNSAAPPPADQAIEFQRTVVAQTSQAGVQFISSGHSLTRTNDPFFLEQEQTISVISGEQQLIDFLYNLGAGNSLIRARDLSIHPDQPRQQLAANITLVASYQKKDPSKSAAAVSATQPPAAKSPTQPPPAKPLVVPAPVPAAKTSSPAMKIPLTKTSAPPIKPMPLPALPKKK